MSHSLFRHASVVLTLVALLLPVEAMGQSDICVTNGNGTTWADANNWNNCSADGPGYPDQGDAAVINTGDDVVLDASDITLDSLRVESGVTGQASSDDTQVFFNSPVTVTGSGNDKNGGIIVGVNDEDMGRAILDVDNDGGNGAGEVSLTGDLKVINNGDLDTNTGSDEGVALIGSNQVVDLSSSENPTIERLETDPGVTLNLDTDVSVTDLVASGDPGSSGLTLDDGGDATTLTVDGAGTIINGDFTLNSGTVDTGANLTVAGNLSVDDSFTLTGNDLTVDGSANDVTALANTGTISTGGGKLVVGDTSNNDRDVQNNGTIQVQNGEFVVSSELTIGSSGDFTIGSDGVARISPDFVGGKLTNNGTLGIGSGTLYTGVTFAQSGALNMNSDGLVLFVGTMNLTGSFRNGNELQNVEVTSSGEVDPEDNVLFVVEQTLTVDGTFGKNDESANLNFSGPDFSVGPDGTFDVNTVKFNRGNGDTTNVDGVVFANVTISDGTKAKVNNDSFTINGKLDVQNNDEFEIRGGTLTLNDDVRIAGTIDPVNPNNGNNNPLNFTGEGKLTDDDNKTQDVTGDSDINFGNFRVDSSGTTVRFSLSDSTVVTNEFRVGRDADASVVSARKINVAGDFEVGSSGSFKFDDGLAESQKVLTFDGGGSQTINSNTDVSLGRVEINNNSGDSPAVSLESGAFLSIAEQLILTQGEVRSNGGLTLEPGARIVYTNDGGGNLASTVTDNVVAERTLSAGADWYTLHPSLSTTYNEFLREDKSGVNDLWIQGPDGSDDPNTDQVNLYYFDESAGGTEDDGWTTLGVESADGNVFAGGASMADAADQDIGLLLYPFSDDDPSDGTNETFPKTIDVVATPQSQTSVSLTLKGSDPGGDGFGSEDGWNLLPNPYLSVIDWDGLLNNSDINGTVYVYDATNDQYATYNGAEDGSQSTEFESYGYISPHQSFFVKASTTNPSDFTVDIFRDQVPSDSSSSDPFIAKSTPQEDRLLRLEGTLAQKEISADFRTTFQSGGKLGWDRFDAYELRSLQSPGNVFFRLYGVLDDGTGLDISNLPRSLDEETIVPVEPDLKGCAGSDPYVAEVTISPENIRNIPSNWGLALKDTETGTLVDLRDPSQSEYTFTIESSSDCSSSKLATSSSSTRTVPRPPSPEVVTQPTTNAKSTSTTRFELIIRPNATLPVELTDFSGTVDGKQAVLKWTTASEQNNAGFQVQRKFGEDGSFEDLQFVDGAGTTNETTEYEFRTNETLKAGRHTFRLKQVNTDGSTSFSDPITVKVGLSELFKLSTYPNPFTEQATIEFAVKEKGNVRIDLYNTLGQKVRTVYNDTPPPEQTQRMRLDARNLSSGQYFLRVVGSSFSTTERITVVR